MSEKVVEFDHECKSCGGTGLYVGMAERDGIGVVCHTCEGTGKAHFRMEYREFEGRKDRAGVKRVLQTNPGIMCGVNAMMGLTIESYGGLPLDDWKRGEKFGPGTENRLHTCPAWFYQSADYRKKPDWKECGFGVFSACSSFPIKSKCWERFDKEQAAK